MTSATRRLAIAAVGILVLFLSWAFVSARPWAVHAAAAPDPRIQALTQREARLRHDAILVQRVVDRRWRHYRIALHKRQVAIARAKAGHRRALAAAQAAAQAAARASAAAASAPAPATTGSYPTAASAAPAAAPPPVRVVTLPPLTITRSS
jgi:hypothetical protein